MDNQEYLILLDKFLNDQASPVEVIELISWFKYKDGFDSWADEQLIETSIEMAPDIRQKLFNQIREKIQMEVPNLQSAISDKKNLPYPWIFRVAVVILLLFTTAVSVYFYTKNQLVVPDLTVTVEKGRKAGITLVDGTKVWVNSGSSLSYGSRFNRNERLVNLEGEAYFDVEPDADRPFIVKTKKFDIKVIGTKFNVCAYSDETSASVALEKGKVEVKTSMHGDILLEPDHVVKIDREGIEVKRTDINEYICWKEDIMQIKSCRVGDIFDKLSRRYGKLISYSDVIGELKMSGKLDMKGNLEDVVSIVCISLSLQYTVDKNGNIVVTKNAQVYGKK